MPAPALAEVRRRQQPIHHFLVGFGGLVLHERLDLGGRRRQADQVERHATKQRAPVGGLSRREPLRFQPGEEKRIDRIARPAAVLDGRESRCMDRLPRPVVALALLEIEGSERGRLLGRALGGPRSAPLHPGGEIGDRLGGQLPAWRHPQVDILIADRLDQPALLRLPRHHRGPTVAALEQPGPAIELETALHFLRFDGVATIAMLDQEGPNFLLEEVDPGRIICGSRTRCQWMEQRDQPQAMEGRAQRSVHGFGPIGTGETDSARSPAEGAGADREVGELLVYGNRPGQEFQWKSDKEFRPFLAES